MKEGLFSWNFVLLLRIEWRRRVGGWSGENGRGGEEVDWKEETREKSRRDHVCFVVMHFDYIVCSPKYHISCPFHVS